MQTRTTTTAKKKSATSKSTAASKLASNATSARTKSAAASKLASTRKPAAKKTTTKKSGTSKTAAKQPGMQTGTGILTDQERITDLMFAEKKMQANYCSFASECVSPKLRDEFLKLHQKSHLTQYDLFTQAQSRGWYKPKAAQATAVKQAYTKFSAMN